MPELRLGEYLVRADTGEILGKHGTTHLEPKSMAVLLYLTEHRGQVISREDLLDAVWPGIHVGDDSLTAAIIKIRRALGDDARNPTHIETIPKRGYRLISPVGAGELTEAEASTKSSLSRPGRPSRWVLSSVALVLGVLAVVVFFGGRPHDYDAPQPPRSDRATVVAVMPFSNFSGDPGQDYLALGISASILNDLARQPGFSVRQILGNTIPTAADDYVLQGNVVHGNGKIRISARLLDGEDGEVLRALQFDRPFQDLLSIEDEIRDTVLTEITGSINAAEKSRRARGYTDNVAAYDLFLQAQRALLVRTAATNSMAQGLYRQAIVADESFARAYGGLALSHAAEYRNGWAKNGKEALGNAMKFAQTAVGISPDLPEQHWVIGYVLTQQRQFSAARTHLDRAIDIAPEFADAYALLGGIETYRGQPDATIPLLRKAQRLNQNAGYLYFLLLARAYYFLDDFEQAQINLREALGRNPENLEARLYLAATLSRLDRPDEAAWEELEILGIDPDFNLNDWAETYPMARGDHFDRLLSDLRRAGFS